MYYYPQPSPGHIIRILQLQVRDIPIPRLGHIAIRPAARKGIAPELAEHRQAVQALRLHVVPENNHDGLDLLPVHPVAGEPAVLVGLAADGARALVHERAPARPGRVLADVVDLADGEGVGPARPQAAEVEHGGAVQAVQLGRHLPLLGGRLLGRDELLDGRARPLEEEGPAEEGVDGRLRGEALPQDAHVAARPVGDARPRADALGCGMLEETGDGVVDKGEVVGLSLGQDAPVRPVRERLGGLQPLGSLTSTYALQLDQILDFLNPVELCARWWRILENPA